MWIKGFFFLSTPSYRCSSSSQTSAARFLGSFFFPSRGTFFFPLSDDKVIWKEMMDRFVDQQKERKREDDLLVLTLAKEKAPWPHFCCDCFLHNSLYSPQTASLGGGGGHPSIKSRRAFSALESPPSAERGFEAWSLTSAIIVWFLLKAAERSFS